MDAKYDMIFTRLLMFVLYFGPINNPVCYLLSSAKSCQKSTCENFVFIFDSHRPWKILRKPQNVQNKAILIFEKLLDITGSQTAYWIGDGNLQYCRAEAGPTRHVFQHYVQTSWNKSTKFRWNSFHCSFTELLQFTKENRAIMLILPNYTAAALLPRGKGNFVSFKTFLQQYLNTQFNTYQRK